MVFREALRFAWQDPHGFKRKFRSSKNFEELRGLWGENVFHYLCTERRVESVRVLLTMGFNVNTVNEFGDTPFTSSIGADDESSHIMELLLSAGADASAMNAAGETPLHTIAGWNCSFDKKRRAFELLLRYGADPNARDDFGNTVLHEICTYPKADTFEIASFMLTNGADINAINKMGRTPLHEVCGLIMLNIWLPDVIDWLLSHGASTDIVDESGEKPDLNPF